MKFKNELFLNEKFMETIAKCNEYEDWEPKGAYWFNRLVKKLRSAQEDFNDTREKFNIFRSSYFSLIRPITFFAKNG